MASNIWAVGAGKGGVGKTFITSSIAITLAKLNHRVLVIDLDTCGGNIHTVFGENPSHKNILSFFKNEFDLMDLAYQTAVPKLSVVQGFTDSWHDYSFKKEDVEKLMLAARGLNFDYVLFDLGPGPTYLHLEIFQRSDERIIITTPEPTTIEKNYRFLEAFISNSIRDAASPEAFLKMQNAIQSYRSEKKAGHFSFRNYLSHATGFSVDFFEELSKRPVRLIMNQTRSKQDEDLGFSIKSVCNKYYDFAIDYVGYVDFDNSVWQSVKNKESVLIEKPFTPIAGQLLSICKHMTSTNFNSNSYRAVV